MKTYIRNLLRSVSPWKPLYPAGRPSGPEYLFGKPHPAVPAGAVTGPDQALSLPPFWMALRKYQTTVGSLPLVVYRRDQAGGRERDLANPAYRLLHDRPNPAMSRSVFFQYLTKEIFLRGNAYVAIRWKGNGQVHALYPLPAGAVTRVWYDDEWTKVYEVQMESGKEIIEDSDMIHVFGYSEDGIQGKSLLVYAAQSLGLHRQVIDSATSFFENAARPSMYVHYPGKLDKNAVENLKAAFGEEYQGTKNAGKVVWVDSGGKLDKVNDITAEEARVIEALGTSRADVAAWFGLSPLALGDLTRGTYSNLAADNASFYQQSVRPLLDQIELEFNHKLFGNSDTYCEFLTHAILKGDPIQEADLMTRLIQAGVMTRAEARELLNMKPLPGLDTPLYPLNQGPELSGQAEPSTNTKPTTEGGADVAEPQAAV